MSVFRDNQNYNGKKEVPLRKKSIWSVLFMRLAHCFKKSYKCKKNKNNRRVTFYYFEWECSKCCKQKLFLTLDTQVKYPICSKPVEMLPWHSKLSHLNKQFQQCFAGFKHELQLLFAIIIYIIQSPPPPPPPTHAPSKIMSAWRPWLDPWTFQEFTV